MTQQEQFEADYLAAYPQQLYGFFDKCPKGIYLNWIPLRVFEIWLQQAKRHEAELRAKAEAQAVSVPSDSEKLSALLYLVERKFPGESRYETAARYIRNAEAASRASTACEAAKDQPK